MIVWILRKLGLYSLMLWLASSLDSKKNEEGASARKLTALSLNIAFLYLIYKYSQKIEWQHFETVLIVILSGEAFFLLLVTVPDLLKALALIKNNKTEVTEVTETKEFKESTEIKNDNELK